MPYFTAFHELVIMTPIAFVLDFFAVGKIAKKKAFSIVDVRKDNPFSSCACHICYLCYFYVSTHEPCGYAAF